MPVQERADRLDPLEVLIDVELAALTTGRAAAVGTLDIGFRHDHRPDEQEFDGGARGYVTDEVVHPECSGIKFVWTGLAGPDA